MIKRYRILAEKSESQTPPQVGSKAVLRVIPEDTPFPPTEETISVVIKVSDPDWGPLHNRIEGYILNANGDTSRVIGYHLRGSTSEDSIGLIEVHLGDA